MTEQTPQPFGYGPSSPKAPAYGPPLRPADGFGASAPGSMLARRDDYAGWGRRVGAYLIDFFPTLVGQVVFFIGYATWIVQLASSGDLVPTVSSGLVPMVVGLAVVLAALGWQIYNRWVTAGRTGQSLGKRVLKIALVSEQSGQPIGALNAFLRDLVHTLDGLAFVGFLWPLWDEKKQTFSDMIMRSAVVDQRRAAALTSTAG